MLRITEIPQTQVVQMLERFSNDALIIACAEGEPYDTGVRSHVHVYLESKHSESWLRKQIQSLDKNRKSNQLYSMKKAHAQSPNYVLKNYYKENENRSRIWFQRNCSLDVLIKWKNQHEEYMAEVNRSKVVRAKSKKSFSKLIIEEVAERFSSPPTTKEIIDQIIQCYKQQDVSLPSRTQMEMYVLNVRLKLGEDIAVREFYMKNFLNY